jgi:phosphohistidine phosphatase
MRLAIMRHGDAVDAEDWHGSDPDRPLTKDGANRATKALRALRRVIRAEEVWTSPWSRARSTAELASTILKLPLIEVPWLAGGAASNKERVEHLRGKLDVLIIGHEPDLGELIGHLIGGGKVPLSKAGVAILKGDAAAGGMELRLLVAPKVLFQIHDSD